MGILFAFVALFSWGIGDFLVQRSTRKFGDGIALFFVSFFVTIVLLPFVWNDLAHLSNVDSRIWLLLGASLVTLFASLLDFEAMRVGKLSIVEPMYALEVPITALLATVLLREMLTRPQQVLVVLLILGIFLISTRSVKKLRQLKWERGVVLALLSMLGFSVTNFLFAVSARETGPLLINWFTSAFIALIMFGFITYRKKWKVLRKDWKEEKGLIISVSILDNLGWIAFAASTVFIPIAIATGISESYIVVAALLGLFITKEKLEAHQKIGLVLAVTAVLILAFITKSI